MFYMAEEGGKSQTRVHETRLGDSRASTMRRSSLAYSSDGMERLGSVLVENCNILRKLFHTAVLLSTSKMEDFGDLNYFFVLRLKNPRVERRGTLLCCEMWRCTYRRLGTRQLQIETAAPGIVREVTSAPSPTFYYYESSDLTLETDWHIPRPIA